MAKISVRVYGNNKEIDIALDDGVLIDDWRDISASECLAMGYGSFKVNGTNLILITEAADQIILEGNPFEGAESGNAEVSFTNGSCNGSGWKWKKL